MSKSGLACYLLWRLEELEAGAGGRGLSLPQSRLPDGWLLGGSQGRWFVSWLLVAAVMMGKRRFLWERHWGIATPSVLRLAL